MKAEGKKEMKMKLTQTKAQRPKRRHVPRRSNCRQCGSENLLTVGPDQFCCECDWDTCREYVDLGLMDSLEVSFLEHFAGEEGKLKADPEKVTIAPDEIKLKEIA